MVIIFLVVKMVVLICVLLTIFCSQHLLSSSCSIKNYKWSVETFPIYQVCLFKPENVWIFVNTELLKIFGIMTVNQYHLYLNRIFIYELTIWIGLTIVQTHYEGWHSKTNKENGYILWCRNKIVICATVATKTWTLSFCLSSFICPRIFECSRKDHTLCDA